MNIGATSNIVVAVRLTKRKRLKTMPPKGRTTRKRVKPHPSPSGRQIIKRLRDKNLKLKERLKGGKELAQQKAKFQGLQLALLERSLESTDFEFNPKNREDLRTLQVDLLHRHLQRTISPQDFALGNQAVGNLIRIMETTELEDRLNELTEQAQIARKAIADRIGMETTHSPNRKPLAASPPRSGHVDAQEQDS